MPDTGYNSPEIEVYVDLIRARRMEEEISKLFEKKVVQGTTHLGIGQEAVSVGVISCLTKNDLVVGTYRGHVAALAKGVPMNEIIAEVLGKATGSNGGYGGSMHLTEERIGFIGNFSVVGGGIPVATGLGLGLKLRWDSDAVAVCFFGDGATNIGYFYESMNMAALFGSKVIFVVENNLYSEHTSRSETTKVEELTHLIREFGISAESSGGNDVEEVKAATVRALAHIRKEGGPFAIEFKTYRMTGHALRDKNKETGYEEQEQAWKTRDPIAIYQRKLFDKGLLSEALDATLHRSVEEEVNTALQSALDAPPSDPLHMEQILYSDQKYDAVLPKNPAEGRVSMRAAINSALKLSMEKDQRILIFGEDVAKWGGVFKVTEGLLEAFGPKRIWDTPISEGSMLGVALGLSLAGYRPVVEIMYSDFIMLAMDAIGNGIAKKRWISGGKSSVPLVIRTACGFQEGWGATHTQVLDNLFSATPGIKIVTPSNAYDAKGLLCAALSGNDPVIFFEHKHLYSKSSSVPFDYYTLPLGKARIAREGSDLTIVANMWMVSEALEAADYLSARGISAEVLDLRTLVPLDEATIISSVEKTGTVVIVDESPNAGGWGNRVAALVAEKCLYFLEHPVRRVTSPDLPLAFSPTLEREFVPSTQKIAEACLKTMSE
ncbi:MAG: dehydrogenase E1 component subunit alpha/beta [Thaumarchaeota archaeon]|nr:dehydrogenase E1 component subunit alpha/beta [Nitrososphaerota archaeon]